MKLHSARKWVTAAAALFALAFAPPARAQINVMPAELENVGVHEHLDDQLPLETPFRDHTGKQVKLGDYFGKKPVVLQFAYHTCPVVCGLITQQLGIGLKGAPWTIGKEFEVVTISIDPNESLEATAKKHDAMVEAYGRAEGAAPDKGWHFLVGDEKAIVAVTNAAGFAYAYDARQKQWAHPSVIMVATPTGRMARYLYGFEFASNDLRLALLEASEGRSISTVEQVILYCYHYDPQGRKYAIVAMNVMRLGAGGVAAILFTVLGTMWARELRKKKKTSKTDDSADAEPEVRLGPAAEVTGGGASQ